MTTPVYRRGARRALPLVQPVEAVGPLGRPQWPGPRDPSPLRLPESPSQQACTAPLAADAGAGSPLPLRTPKYHPRCSSGSSQARLSGSKRALFPASSQAATETVVSLPGLQEEAEGEATPPRERPGKRPLLEPPNIKQQHR